jgi:hypothetical protein
MTGRKRKDHKAEYYYLVRWAKKEKNDAPEVSVQGLTGVRSGKIKILPISELFSRGPVLNGP